MTRWRIEVTYEVKAELFIERPDDWEPDDVEDDDLLEEGEFDWDRPPRLYAIQGSLNIDSVDPVEEATTVADLMPSAPWPEEWREGRWPVESVLATLADAADHLLGDHNCDRHGHELVLTAATRARQMLADAGYSGGADA